MSGTRPVLQATSTIVILAALAFTTACSDRIASPVDITEPDPPDSPTAHDPDAAVTALACQASVATGTVRCALPPEPEGRDGIDAEPRTIGGQGTYVRLSSANVAFAGGMFSFDVTVQNLSNLAMATEDGAARHEDGVRVFFHDGPSTTAGTGNVSIANATGTATFTGAMQPYFQYGGEISGLEQGELGGDGILSPGEVSDPRTWELAVDAGVDEFAFTVFVWAETPGGEIETIAPQVTGVSPATIEPGGSATLTGTNFHATAGNNTVTMGGAEATVTAASATELTVTVPCALSGAVPVDVSVDGLRGVALNHPLQAPQHTLDVGEAAVLHAAGTAGCNELVASGEESRYVVAVYSTSSSPATATSFELSADGVGWAEPMAAARAARAARAGGLDPLSRQTAEQDAAHRRVMEANAREHERLSRIFADDPRMRRSATMASTVEPPLTKTIRVADLDETHICENYHEVNATRVYYSGKLAIYEDDAIHEDLKAANNPTMAAHYQNIGDQYNDDMEPILQAHFGDPLIRDAVTDNNGVLIALFTRVINDNYPNLAGFVLSCDQYPRGTDSNLTSNFGEYFYARVPNDVTTEAANGWYASIRATFIHEAKHVASHAARVHNGAAFENSWLEEGTARHAEELWARISIYDVPWKGNTGYGSSAEWDYIFCDVRTTWPQCAESHPDYPLRPSVNMVRHFSASGLYWWLGNSRTSSPFGTSASDSGTTGSAAFYASSWSLIRYAIDRYATSEADFLTALNQSSTTGVTNLTARAGVSMERLLGEWALALYASDYPGLASPGPELQMPTWDFESIYTGLQTDLPAIYTRSRHVLPAETHGFGAHAPVAASGITGGGVVYYEYTGTHADNQLLRLTGAGGGALPGTIRIAIARLE